MQSILSYSQFHLVGIQGVGMTALALILNDMGRQVSGSDIVETYLTKEVLLQRGIEVNEGFLPEHVTHAEVVVYSGAFGGETNSEVEEARKLGKTVLNLAEILGELSRTKNTIAVAGCHGKTTTTSLLSYVGEELGMNMSYYVGASGFMHHPPGRWQVLTSHSFKCYLYKYRF